VGECTIMLFTLAGFLVERELVRTWPVAGARYASAKQTRLVSSRLS
jgi:hypothetical protein